MTSQPNVLLLVGSAKRAESSTSQSLGGYLCARLAERGWVSRTLHVHMALRTEGNTLAMLEAVDAAGLVVLATPLYVDCLPYLVTVAMERIAAHRDAVVSERGRMPRFAAIINCGFPEAQHNDVALAICRQFASEAGLPWVGGLSMGGGGVVGGSPLAELGSRASGIRRALDEAAIALAAGDSVPQQAIDRLAKPAIPPWMYTTIGNVGWHVIAWRQDTHGHLHDRPYEMSRR